MDDFSAIHYIFVLMCKKICYFMKVLLWLLTVPSSIFTPVLLTCEAKIYSLTLLLFLLNIYVHHVHLCSFNWASSKGGTKVSHLIQMVQWRCEKLEHNILKHCRFLFIFSYAFVIVSFHIFWYIFHWQIPSFKNIVKIVFLFILYQGMKLFELHFPLVSLSLFYI